MEYNRINSAFGFWHSTQMRSYKMQLILEILNTIGSVLRVVQSFNFSLATLVFRVYS